MIALMVVLLREKRRRERWNETRRRRVGGVTRAECLAQIRVSPEHKRLLQIAVLRRRHARKRRARLDSGEYHYVNGTVRRKRPAAPWKEKRLPLSAIAEMGRRRRAYVGWWKWQLYHRYDAPYRIGNRKLAEAIRRRLKKILGKKLLTPTWELIGCSVAHLRGHLESQFSRTMTWENYGSVWSIDHIVPLAKFDLTKKGHILMANHYTNLRPLACWANSWKQDRLLKLAAQPELAMPVSS